MQNGLLFNPPYSNHPNRISMEDDTHHNLCVEADNTCVHPLYFHTAPLYSQEDIYKRSLRYYCSHMYPHYNTENSGKGQNTRIWSCHIDIEPRHSTNNKQQMSYYIS